MAYAHILVIFITWCLILESGFAQRNITSTRFLRNPEIIESSNAIFKMGFFSPINSSNRYLGIWYSNQESDRLEVAWVANRENPITDTSGVLKVVQDGNLQVLDGQNRVFWSSNLSRQGDNTVAELLGTGNLVLRSIPDGTIIWQSFEHPTDSFLPQMRFTITENTGNKIIFRSWKSPSDPSSSNITVGINSRVPPQAFLWKDGRPYWRSSQWNGNIFISKDTILNILNDNGGNLYFGFNLGDQSVSVLQHFVLNYDGSLVQKDWNASIRKWEVIWRAVESDCDIYGKCGPFGICSSKNSSICGCLKGFVPKNNEEWDKGNWTDGCVRRTSLQCETKGDRADEFWKVKNVKIPDDAEWFSTDGDEEKCRSRCLGNCACLAYAYYSSIGCMIWNESLIDIKEYYTTTTTGIDLSIRLDYSEIGETNQTKQQSPRQGKAGKRKLVIALVVIGISIVPLTVFCVCKRMCQRNETTEVMGKETFLQNSKLEGGTSKDEFGDLPVFRLEELAIATDHFQETNKLGRGGFGTVYKGRLEDNQEIAVKRLAKGSGQGLQEFMNEVLVISRLQHRNLVKLLGCCIEGEEKMLVYEFMPNNSLDALLFDPSQQKLLDWKTRYNIILGICRGLLYLHRDSRLRIIHRDLKASNILLDGDLNPKISDFGMARIFGSNQDQGDTKRIVGTYGYMSPEYAMEGRFSEKSDVFSLGVLLLEIVSGRRNSSFKYEDSLSLLRHAWKLWNGNNILSLIDPTIIKSTFQMEILRCIHLGLLCVQEFSEDRPSASTVVSMLESEVLDLPRPTQPGFTQRKSASLSEAQRHSREYCSVNSVSISLNGR